MGFCPSKSSSDSAFTKSEIQALNNSRLGEDNTQTQLTPEASELSNHSATVNEPSNGPTPLVNDKSTKSNTPAGHKWGKAAQNPVAASNPRPGVSGSKNASGKPVIPVIPQPETVTQEETEIAPVKAEVKSTEAESNPIREPEPIIENPVAVVNSKDQLQNPAAGKPNKNGKSSKGGNNSGGKNRAWNMDLYMGLGWVKAEQKLKLNEIDPRFMHRDFAEVVTGSIGSISGSQFSMGLRGNFKGNWTFEGGFQYTQMQNKFQFDYTIKDYPVLDTQKRMILGYERLQDSFWTSISMNRIVTVSTIALPFQFGYSKIIRNNWCVTGALGLMPQFHFSTEFVLPGDVNITALKYLELGKYFNMPASMSLGVYRKEDKFTYGLMGRACPLYTKERDLAGYGNLRYRSYDVGFRIMYNFSGAKTGKR